MIYRIRVFSCRNLSWEKTESFMGRLMHETYLSVVRRLVRVSRDSHHEVAFSCHESLVRVLREIASRDFHRRTSHETLMRQTIFIPGTWYYEAAHVSTDSILLRTKPARTIWYDMMWWGMVWYDTIWCGLLRRDMNMIWYNMMGHDMIWYGMLHGMVLVRVSNGSIAEVKRSTWSYQT